MVCLIMQIQINQLLARKDTRVRRQEVSENTRIVNKIRRQADSEITRLTKSLPRPTKGSSAPIQKEEPVLSLSTEKNAAKIPRSGRSHKVMEVEGGEVW